MTPNEAFDYYMSSLSPRERIAKSRDLTEIGKLEKYTISDWRRGRAKIPIAWQHKISEIVGVNVFANVEIN